ncbi:T-cell surface glycoprotein CD3 delta chain [Labeo rohita]|uniref:T-cell surface glycoprotein CD3 delta chain n=1 Tax=Labeo rohita TaxID=84645 RepID=A0ABQ8M3Z2_LABRO|nr:T-cell surface glycoprotein CD3 delta chain [Labeo rohita]
MDRRVIVLFCLLTAVRSEDADLANSQKTPVISVEKGQLECKGGKFDGSPSIPINYENSGLHTCISDDCTDDSCPTQNVLVKVLGSDNLIQLDMRSVATVIVSDILVTVLIGWAVYSICAQPKTRGGYQGNKASDRVNLINNHNQPGGDTYQPLNTRADEYSTLHAPRKHKNKQSV